MHNRASCLFAVITLAGRVDAGAVQGLERDAERALVAGSRTIIVDLRAVHHIDTSTLTELTVALRVISRRRAALAVVGADARVEWVLELCDIHDLECHLTLRRALAAVRDGRRPAADRGWRGAPERPRPAPQRPSARF